MTKREFLNHIGGLQRLIEASQEDSVGFCVACGAEAYGVEPDARRYECECCGEHRVFGASELIMEFVL